MSGHMLEMQIILHNATICLQGLERKEGVHGIETSFGKISKIYLTVVNCLTRNIRVL